MIGKYRAWYEKKGKILGKKISKLPITPNQLTLLSLIPGAGACYFLAEREIFLGIVLMALSFAVDALDGSLARATGMTTKTGKVLDPVIDRYIEFLVLLGIVLGEMVKPWIALYCLFGMLMASYARARAESIEPINLLSVGIMERQEKFLLLLIGLVLFNQYADSLNYALLIIGTLSHITVAQRLLRAKKEMGE
ncbi:MAG: CDP-alcohol phosphatidyltransferase family protein [Euryarchaeota archaeon]|nr:CDP-alcohol phosphatidyltransferase family protein [Euryarchaeota archaeon]